MENKRLDRVNSEIKKSISNIISQQIRDPRVNGLITVVSVDTSNDLSHSKVSVDTSNDLSHSKVLVSIYASDKRQEMSSFNALQHSAGFIRKNLAKMVDLRIVPELHFKLDHGYEESEKMDRLLASLDIPKEE